MLTYGEPQGPGVPAARAEPKKVQADRYLKQSHPQGGGDDHLPERGLADRFLIFRGDKNRMMTQPVGALVDEEDPCANGAELKGNNRSVT